MKKGTFIFAALLLPGLAAPMPGLVRSVRAADDSPPRFDTGSLDNGPSANNARPRILDQVGIDQHLNGQLPMDAVFTDETGRSARLGDFFNKRPVVLQILQFNCQNLCTMELNGMCRTASACPLQPGTDYDIMTISFDPTETPQIGASKKQIYVSQINKDGVAGAWHFLTGSPDSIKAVTQAAGFRYAYDATNKQYVHSGALFILTPDGRLSKYLYLTAGEYSPNDLRLAVADAGASKIGSLSDEILLFCFHYDPDTGRYTLAVRNLLRLFGGITVLALGTFMFLQFRREKLAAARQ
jgi:protein SCO1